MSEIKTKPSSREYRDGWERVFEERWTKEEFDKFLDKAFQYSDKMPKGGFFKGKYYEDLQEMLRKIENER